MDLYKSLQILLQDWPQLLKDFAAFLLPEQALACGLVSREGGKEHTIGSLGQSRTGLGRVDQDCSRLLAWCPFHGTEYYDFIMCTSL